MSLGPKQLALLGVARKRLALDEETYRDVLHAVAGVESARDLDQLGFDQVMRRFRELGFESDWAKRNFGGARPGMATPSQLEMIRGLWRDYAGADDEAGLNGWLRRTAKCDALRFLDREGAHAAISGLRAMVARKKAAASA